MTQPVRLQLSRRAGFNLQALSLATNSLPAVKVTRPGRWGNPFHVDSEGVACEAAVQGLDGSDRIDRATASIDLFRRWLTGGKVNELIGLMLPRPDGPPPQLRIIERDLRGKNLACWCKPGAPCHADVLLEIANRPVCEAVRS